MEGRGLNVYFFDFARLRIESEVGEDVKDGLEERGWSRNHAVAAYAGIGETKMFAGTRYGYIESASIFADMVLVVVFDVVEIGIGTLGGIEHNDTVEFEAFGLMGCGDEETLVAVV